LLNANENGRIVHETTRTNIHNEAVTEKVKSYKKLYPKLCSYDNLDLAFKKARKGKSKQKYVKEFEKDLQNNLLNLKKELLAFEYKPTKLTKFIVRDPKTRVIRKSVFKDRIVHHAVVNILDPIYEKVFLYDNYANRKNKGSLNAINRFDYYKRKISNNGKLVNNSKNKNMIEGYCLKADLKHFFDSVDQTILIKILKRKIRDNNVLWLIKQILENHISIGGGGERKGMPLGNMTSQFFANVYLNELDYFVKHKLKVKCYIRYVDDFIILHKNKKVLLEYKRKITNYLKNLGLELHPDKTKIFSMYRGVTFLGYKLFYYFRLLKKRNVRYFLRRLQRFEERYNENLITSSDVLDSIEGWLAYAIWADSYNLRKRIIKEINNRFKFNWLINSTFRLHIKLSLIKKVNLNKF